MGGGLTSLTSFASFSSLAMHDSNGIEILLSKTEPTSTHTPIIHTIRHQLFITMSLLL